MIDEEGVKKLKIKEEEDEEKEEKKRKTKGNWIPKAEAGF